MKLNYVVVLIVFIVSLVLLAGCTGTPSAPEVTPTPEIVYVTVLVTLSPGQVAVAPPTAIPTAVPTTATSTPLTIQGNSDDVRSFTTSGDGIRIFAMSYSGEKNFAIWLEDSQGNKLDLLANEIGSYTGKKSERLGPGTYYLDVTASGPWTVTVTSM